MAAILNALKSINAYPIPFDTFKGIAEGRGLNIEDEATPEVRRSRDFCLAKADVYAWLVGAPNVTQQGITYNFTADQQKAFRRQAIAIYRANDEELPESLQSSFGYKGELL